MNIEDKVNIAIHRIEDFYLQTCGGGGYLSFSGGKDSTVVMALIKMCSDLVIPPNSIPCVFIDTGLELGATIDFAKWCKENYYANVQIIRPKKSFSYVLKEYGKPIKSKLKSHNLSVYQKNKNSKAINYLLGQLHNGKNYAKTKLADKDMHMLHDNFDIRASDMCCKILKKDSFKQYAKENNLIGYMTGERISEGGARELNAYKRLKDGGKLCTKISGKYTVKMPIIDWTDEDVEEFIELYNVPLSKAYTDYKMTRTGCFCCPFSMQLKDDLKTLHEYEPNRYKASMHWLKDVYIAQNVELPFDERYEKERIEKWENEYEQMRYEVVLKYRPQKKYKYKVHQKRLF